MAVLDVLPSGVVSVYFVYDVRWKDSGLGKVSSGGIRFSGRLTEDTKSSALCGKQPWSKRCKLQGWKA